MAKAKFFGRSPEGGNAQRVLYAAALRLYNQEPLLIEFQNSLLALRAVELCNDGDNAYVHQRAQKRWQHHMDASIEKADRNDVPRRFCAIQCCDFGQQCGGNH